MLAVLKSTKIRSKPGRKKKGKSSGKVVEQKNNKSKHKKNNTTGTGNTTPNEFENQYSPGSCISGHSSKSPAFSPRSVASSENFDENDSNKKAGNSKSKSKAVCLNKALIELGWRSKHKNVIDPVFLAELEHLIQVILISRF